MIQEIKLSGIDENYVHFQWLNRFHFLCVISFERVGRFWCLLLHRKAENLRFWSLPFLMKTEVKIKIYSVYKIPGIAGFLGRFSRNCGSNAFRHWISKFRKLQHKSEFFGVPIPPSHTAIKENNLKIVIRPKKLNKNQPDVGCKWLINQQNICRGSKQYAGKACWDCPQGTFVYIIQKNRPWTLHSPGQTQSPPTRFYSNQS